VSSERSRFRQLPRPQLSRQSAAARVLASSGWLAACVLGACWLGGCSSTGAVAQPEIDSGAPLADTSVVSDGTSDATTDEGTVDAADAASDTRTDGSSIDAADAESDGAKPDTGPVDAGPTFACGSTTCSAGFQFCRIATTPGICPPADAGVCPAGCPGCPPLSRACETLPGKCWAKPSCACILVEVCGAVAAGTCTEKDSGFTVGCKGV
jgi:hypothetical protein